ncbi:MAG: hypothetical protein DIU78_018080 [Pseudomonadota bacterium]
MNFRDAGATVTTPSSARVEEASGREGSLGLALLALEQAAANIKTESEEAMGLTKHWGDMAPPPSTRRAIAPRSSIYPAISIGFDSSAAGDEPLLDGSC